MWVVTEDGGNLIDCRRFSPSDLLRRNEEDEGGAAASWVRQRPRPGWCAAGGAFLLSPLAGDMTTVRARPTDAYAASCDGDAKTRWRAAACRHSLIRR